ncbi:RhaT Permeases of the drug/metabolite transporter (DMT) superfamily [Candidatus Nanopelagicaceae bacterium]
MSTTGERVNSSRAGILAVLGAAFCFGTTGTTQQLGVPDISPVAVASARLLCGALFLFIFANLLERRNSGYRMPRTDLFIAGCGIAIYQLTFFSAVDSTGIAIATVTALGTAPTFSAIVAYLILREKPLLNWYIGTSVTIIGIVLVGTANGVEGFNFLGIVLASIAGLGFAIFNVICRKSLEKGASDIWVTAQTFGVAALFSAPFLFAESPVWLTTRNGILTTLWLGIFTTSVGYILFMYGLKRIPSSLAATVVLAEPATATILAAVVIGEPLVGQSYLGIATVALGILYISKRKRVSA